MPALGELESIFFLLERQIFIKPPEEFFRAEIEAHPDTLTFFIFPDGSHSTFVGKQFSEAVGFSESDWRAETDLWSNHIIIEDRDRVRKEFETQMSENKPFDSQYRFNGKNDLRELKDHSEFVRGSDGSILFYKCTLTDVTALTELLSEVNYSQALSEAISAVSSSLNEKEVLDAIAQQIGNIVDYTSASIHHVDYHQEHPHITMSDKWSGSGHIRTIQNIIKDQPASDNPPIEQVIKTGLPVVIPDTTDPSLWKDRGSKTKSYIGIPLIIEGKVIAVLNLNSSTPGRYTTQDLEKLTPFAQAVTIAIEHARMHERVVELTRIDELTQLPNDRAYAERINQDILETLRMDDQDLYYLYFDLDRFSLFNDYINHDAGDFILKTFADILRKNIREIDFAARPHKRGEEFTLLLKFTTKQQAVEIANRIRDALVSVPPLQSKKEGKRSKHDITLKEGENIYPAVSIGIASLREIMTHFDLNPDRNEKVDVAKIEEALRKTADYRQGVSKDSDLNTVTSDGFSSLE